MRTEAVQKSTPQTMLVEHFRCDKCGAPCGKDEPERSSEVKECLISTQSSQKVELVLGGGDEAKVRVGFFQCVRVHAKDGTSFGYTGNVRNTHVDCCLKCFYEFVLPALEALGFKPRTEHGEY